MNTSNYWITQLLAISSRYALPWTWCSNYSALRHIIHLSSKPLGQRRGTKTTSIHPAPLAFHTAIRQYSPSIHLNLSPLVSSSISTMPDRCPFCNIAATNPPAPFNEPPSESAAAGPISDASKTTAHMILSTEHVMAFLDIMPLTPGHVLVAPRRHYEMLGDMGVQAGQEMGKWLPIISRVVTKTIFGEDPDRHWNVVQNNGARAAQVVPHVHFHIIPRPQTEGVHKPGFAMFGRGQRSELDDDEGEELSRAMRAELVQEIKRIHREEGIDLSADLVDRGKL